MMEIPFEAGLNIATKIPKRKYEQTVAFYRDILKLEVEEKPMDHPTVSRTHRVQFGHNVVWLDCVDSCKLRPIGSLAATEYARRGGS